MTLAAGGGGSSGCGCDFFGCYLVGGVMERQVGSFTRCKSVKAFCAVCVFALQTIGCLCSNRGQFFSTQLYSSAALGSVSFAARLVNQALFPPACPLWQSAGVQIVGPVLTRLAPGAEEAGGTRRQGIKSREVSCGLGWQLAPESRSHRGGPEGPTSSRNVSCASWA